MKKKKIMPSEKEQKSISCALGWTLRGNLEMCNEAEHSNIKLLSNIMIKSKYEKDPLRYLPADLLPDYYVDIRAQGTLTQAQRKQFEKKLFYAKRIVDR